MTSASSVDELDVDPHPSAGTPGATFKQIAHAKITCDPAHVTDLPL
jgi:hypothetical protein